MSDSLNLGKKLRRIHLLIFIFSGIILLAAFRWQAVEAAKMKQIGEERLSISPIKSIRGSVYASDGTTLAYSEPRFDVFVWLKDLEYYESLGLQTRDEFLKKVAPVIDTTPEVLQEKIDNFEKQGILWIPIAKSISDKQWDALSSLRTEAFSAPLQGIQFENISQRIYPQGRLASHALGLTNIVNNKVIGLGGVEEAWNELLNPINGVIIQESNAKGEAVATALVATTEAKQGSSVYLTIDTKLQKVLESQLKGGVEKYAAQSGTAIIMDPKTGEIMALANYPDYDPNLREEKDPNVYGNLAVTSPYEMGSIGKALTIAAAVDLQRVDAETVILPNGHQGCEKFTDELGPLCTWDKTPKPPMPLKECFALSDNICLFHLSKDHMSPAEFRSYLVGFGIGKPSGVDLAGESYAPLRDLSDWTIGDVAATSYGQGYSVNAVQAISAVAAIANNGVRMKPFVVNKIVDGDGNVKEYKPEVVQRVISQDAANQVMAMMNYNMGEAIPSYEYEYDDIRNYKLGMKSGSGQIASQSGYNTDEIDASFVGFDESPQRTFILFMKLEKPQKGYSMGAEVPNGGSLSFYNVRPLWMDTFLAIKDVIGVPSIDQFSN